MGRAIFEGALAAGVLDAASVVVAEPDPGRADHFAGRGAATFRGVPDAIEWLRDHEKSATPGVVLLAIKPQTLPQVGPELRREFDRCFDAHLLISILAGTPIAKIQSAVGDQARIIRAMPNMAAQIGRGATALWPGTNARDPDVQFASSLFRAVGSVFRLTDEGMMDAFTAVVGSGPAYLFFLANAMIDAAVTFGFNPATAWRIVGLTLAGSAELFEQSGTLPGELLATVQSKGGTTEAAMNILARERVHEAFIAALTAARDRGRELAR
jgi:pyrroline-5-carboxylate reductase